MSRYGPMRQLAKPFVGLSGGAILGGLACVMVAFFALGGLIRGAGLAPGDTALTMTLILCGYALPALALILYVSRWVGIAPVSLFGPLPQVRAEALVALRTVLLALAATLVITVLAIGFLGAAPAPPEEGGGQVRSVSLWLTFLPVAAIAVLLQSGSEEIVFRGFLMPALRARTANPLIWLGAPALLFGLAHVPYAETPSDAVFVMTVTGLLGLAMGDLTARTGSIGAAVGFHWAWNLWQFSLFAQIDAPMSGFALFLHPPAPAQSTDPLTLLAVALSILIPWLAIRVSLWR